MERLDFNHAMRRNLTALSDSQLTLALTVAILLILTSCGSRKEENEKADSGTQPQTAETYHADNDIAMTIRSIADAIRVGEPLDTTGYNFSGVLTDGEGHPLYTDLQGSPGTWEVDVLTPTSAVIRNTDLGDLLPEDLKNYIAGNLGLTSEDLVETAQYDDEDDTEITVYDFDGGYLRMETRKGVSPNGLEGPLMRIMASRETPVLN